MYFSRQEIADKVSKISQARHGYDLKYSELQKMLKQKQKFAVVDLRSKFTTIVTQLQDIAKDNQTVLDLLSYRCEKLAKEGVQLNSQKIRIQSLKDYFKELKDKVKRQQQRGEEIISGLQRWELSNHQGLPTRHDEEQSLLNSHNAAKETTEIARGVFESLANQGSRLQNARQKMSSVVRNINFSGNLAQVLRTRTKQDNRLIAMLSLGLVLWILICLFAIKPWYRGT